MRTKVQKIPNAVIVDKKCADLSAETLLEVEKQEALHRRLVLLFKTNDIDGSGALDLHEFTSCIKSLNLDISEGEIESLYAFAAKTPSAGEHLTFDDFASFVSEILLDLVREKRLRAMELAHRGRYLRASVAERMHGKAEALREAYLQRCILNDQNLITIDYAAIQNVLQGSPFELSGTALQMLMMEVSPADDEPEPIYELSLVHGTILEGLSNSQWTLSEAQFQADVERYMAHPLFLTNAGVDIAALVKSLIKVDAEAVSEGMTRKRRYLRTIRNNGYIRRSEANFMVAELLGRGLTSENSGAPTADELECAWRASHRLTLLRRLSELQSPQEMLESTLSLLEREVTRSGGRKETGHRGLSDLGSNGLSLRKCMAVLEDMPHLGLARREVLHALFTLDCQDLGPKVTKLKKLAKAAVDTAVLVRRPEFLTSSRSLLDFLLDHQPHSLGGLTSETLVEWIQESFPSQEAEGESLISEQSLARLLPSVPHIFLGEKECCLVIATLPFPESGLIDREVLVGELFGCMCRVWWARAFARRLDLLQALDAEEHEDQGSSSVLRLAERLLNSVKLENWNGNIRVCFPDVSTRSLHSGNEEEEQRDRILADDAMVTRTRFVDLPLSDSPGQLLSARVSTSLRTSTRGMSATSTLEVVAETDGLPELRLRSLGVPTLAVIDEEAASELVELVVHRLVIERAEGENGVTYHLVLDSETDL